MVTTLITIAHQKQYYRYSTCLSKATLSIMNFDIKSIAFDVLSIYSSECKANEQSKHHDSQD